MRIALTITELDVGGAEKCLTQLACWLKRVGHTVEVFSLGPEPPIGQAQFPETLVDAGIPIHFGGFTSARRALPALRWLRKALREFSPDIVQSMLFHANVLTSLAVPSKGKFFGGARVKQPERIRGRLQRWASRRMEKLICVSVDVAKSCAESELIPTEKIEVIPNGVSVSNKQTPGDWQELGLPVHCRVILSVGRLAKQKGYRELILRSDEILSHHPEHHIVIAGQGPLETELRCLIENTNARTRIHLAGWLSDVDRWLSACEIFALPTHYEGMPNALLEAMAAGKPVIVNDVEGIRELLGSGPFTEAQIAAPLSKDDGKSFANSTLKLITAEQLRHNCGEANMKRVLEHFRAEDQFQKYLDIYEAVVGQPPIN